MIQLIRMAQGRLLFPLIFCDKVHTDSTSTIMYELLDTTGVLELVAWLNIWLGATYRGFLTFLLMARRPRRDPTC